MQSQLQSTIAKVNVVSRFVPIVALMPYHLTVQHYQQLRTPCKARHPGWWSGDDLQFLVVRYSERGKVLCRTGEEGRR
jgi:hypothetical protein